MPISQPPDVSSGECPPPLHIIKKRHKPNPTGSPKRTSPDADESSGSISDSLASDQPLTVVKKRASRIQGPSSQEVNRSFHFEQSKAVPVDPRTDTPLDSITPKADQSTVNRRWSSRQFRRSFAPKALDKLRPSHTGRASSSKATCQEQESRNSSDSSSLCSSTGSNHQQGVVTRLSSYQWEHGSNRGLEELAYQRNGTVACSSRQTSYPTSSAHGSDDTVLDPYLLVPNVSITPEVHTVDGGQSSLWVAIEISGQLFRPFVLDDVYNTSGMNSLFMPVHHGGDGLSRYGYLYNIKIDILPTAHSSIIDIIDDTTSRIIHPGSSILILANIQLNASQAPQTSGKRKHEPDDLFADLEFQLGSVKTEYVQVRLGYCHSGFPMLAEESTTSGISSNHTQIETTTTGVIKRHSPASIWSPHSIPGSNALFPIIASHWGPVRAHDIMDKITTPRPSPRRLVRGNHKSMFNIGRGENVPKTPETAVKVPEAPRIPRRQASLGRQILALDTEEVDPARKIWTEMRRTSSGRDPPSLHVSKARRIPVRSTALDPVTSKNATAVSCPQSEVERRRQQIRDTALQNKRSIGADSLRSLVPSLANFHLDGTRDIDDNVIKENRKRLLPTEQKNEGRWNFGSWW